MNAPKRKVGRLIAAAGAVVAVLPAVLAIVLTPLLCGPGANEGNCGVAALPWLLFFSVPLGGLLVLAGLVWALASRTSRRS